MVKLNTNHNWWVGIYLGASSHLLCPMSIMSQGAVVNASQICPVGEARWQGEWLMETDFLKDFQACYGQWMDSK